MDDKQVPVITEPAPCHLSLKRIQENRIVRAAPQNQVQPNKETKFSSDRDWLERCMNLERKISELEIVLEEERSRAYNEGYEAGSRERELKIENDVRRGNNGDVGVLSTGTDIDSDGWEGIIQRARAF